MSETITFREVKLEGGWLMVKPERDDLGKAMAVVRKHKDRLYDLEVKEHRKKRSLDANAYAWVLINKIADALRITPKEIYRQVWKEAPLGSDNTVAVHIRHLREKIEINPADPRYLKVVWGQGYKMEKGAKR